MNDFGSHPTTHPQSVSQSLSSPSFPLATDLRRAALFVRSFVRSFTSFVRSLRSFTSFTSFVRSFVHFVCSSPHTCTHGTHKYLGQPPPAATTRSCSRSQAVRQVSSQHSLPHSLPPSLPALHCVRSLIRSFVCSVVRSFVCSFVRSCVRSFVFAFLCICLSLFDDRTDGRTDRPDDRTDARTVTSSQPTTRRTAARRSSGPPDTTATRHTHPCLRAWAACALCCGSHARGGVITPAPRLACERVAVRSSWARNSRRRHNPPPSTMLRRPSCGGLRTRHSLLALCTHCHRRSVDEHGPSDGEAQRLCRCPRSCACGEASRCYVRAVSCSFFSSASFPVLFFPWLGSSWCLFVLRPALLFDTHAPALFCLFCFLNHRRQEVFP